MLKQKYSRQKEETDEMEARRNKLEAQMAQVLGRAQHGHFLLRVSPVVQIEGEMRPEELLHHFLGIISYESTPRCVYLSFSFNPR